jgi:ABC-type nickel/cobalt efflux system permease component RcnA
MVTKFARCSLLFALCSLSLMAHPMGNFSINHYSRIELREQGAELTYILDFAEIPTSELIADWGENSGSGEALQRNAARQAVTWAQGLSVTINSQPVPVPWSNVDAATIDGAGGMPVLRVVMQARLGSGAKGELNFRDNNFASRTGWKEIVIAHGDHVAIDAATQSDRDLSKGLTTYPADLTVTPPQDLAATANWHSTGVVVAQAKPVQKPALAKPVVDAELPSSYAVASPSFTSQQPEVAGTVKRGDYLSRMLQEKRFGVSAILLGLLAAFGLGAMHALSPGHGKTIVAAYLVGSRGTLKHAGILGLTVTFTHTISVFLLGIGVLFFQKYVIPEKVVPVLGAISGLSIVAIGAYLLYKRSLALVATPASRPHSHSHSHAHSHSHSHDGSTHSHAIPEKITMGTLLGLGVSGGLVPCPSALILLLSAISLGQVAIGLALLGAFSAGLAVVLMAVGGLVLYGKQLLPKGNRVTNHPFVRLLPVFSSVVVIVVGLLMTLTAAGIIQPAKLFT